MELLSGIKPDSLTSEQKRKLLREFNRIKLKRSGKLKGRMCVNGAPHCKFVLGEEAKSSTINLE